MNQLNKIFFKSNSLLVEWGLFFYVVICFLISHLLHVPEVVLSILSLPSWLILPYFFGSILQPLFQGLKLATFERADRAIFSLLFGIYFLIISIFILDLTGLSFVLKNFHLVILFLALVYLIHKTYRKGDNDFSVPIEVIKKYVPIVVFCILVGAIPALMKISVSPFPYGTIETTSIPFEQYQPALRFMDFGYIQHYRVYDYVSLGFSSNLFNIDPLSFIWATPFLMMTIFCFGLYLLSYSIGKSEGLALVTVFIGAFLNMNIFRDTPLLFKANVFLYIFLPFILYLFYKYISKKQYNLKDAVLPLFLFGFITILFFYLIESNIWSNFVPHDLIYPREWRSHIWLPLIVVLTAPVLFVTTYFSQKIFGKNSFFKDNALLLLFAPLFCLTFLNLEAIAFIIFIYGFIFLLLIGQNKKTCLLLYIFLGFIFSFILFQNFVVELPVTNPVSSVFSSFSSELDSVSFSVRFDWLFEKNLALPLTALLIIGISVGLLSKNNKTLFIISAFALALFLYLFPEDFAYRFFREVTITMTLVISTGIGSFFKLFKIRKRYSSIIFSALLVILLLPALISPVYERNYQSYLGKPILAEYEYIAAKWIRDNGPENSILLSDYHTMLVLGTLSNSLLPVNRNFRVEGLNENDTQTVWSIKRMLSLMDFVKTPIASSNTIGFWKPYGIGNGLVGVELEELDSDSEQSNVIMHIVEGGKSNIGVVHRYSEKQDWSFAKGIYLNWYGKNTGVEWQICIVAPDDSNWFNFNFKDEFYGLKTIEIKFSDFGKVGSPNWENISYITIRTTSALIDYSWYLGEIGYLSYPEGVSLKIDYDDLWYLKENLPSTESRYTEENRIKLDDLSVIVVVVPRTLKWINQDGITTFSSIEPGPVSVDYLIALNNDRNLELIYSYQTDIYIFKLINNE